MSTWATFSDDDFSPKASSEVMNDAAESDPWSNQAWADLSEFHAATHAKDFSRDIFDMALDVFSQEDMEVMEVSQDAAVPEVQVAIHEQLSSLYDGTEDAEVQVIGSIIVRPEEGVKDSFCFVVKDFAGQLEQFQEETNVCKEITDSIPYAKAEVGDRVLRVTYPSDSKPKQMTVATYTCGNVVHPIPLVCLFACLLRSFFCFLLVNRSDLFNSLRNRNAQLLKSKVQITDKYCRVGLKMRANPMNEGPLSNGTILVAVPPDVQGDSVRTSCERSIWDSMKRVVAWPLDPIEPGQLLEIQAQFEFESPKKPDGPAVPTPKFPVLVRCDAANEQFSDLQLNTDVNDNQFRPIKLKVSRSVRILHRKV